MWIVTAIMKSVAPCARLEPWEDTLQDRYQSNQELGKGRTPWPVTACLLTSVAISTLACGKGTTSRSQTIATVETTSSTSLPAEPGAAFHAQVDSLAGGWAHTMAIDSEERKLLYLVLRGDLPQVFPDYGKQLAGATNEFELRDLKAVTEPRYARGLDSLKRALLSTVFTTLMSATEPTGRVSPYNFATGGYCAASANWDRPFGNDCPTALVRGLEKFSSWLAVPPREGYVPEEKMLLFPGFAPDCDEGGVPGVFISMSQDSARAIDLHGFAGPSHRSDLPDNRVFLQLFWRPLGLMTCITVRGQRREGITAELLAVRAVGGVYYDGSGPATLHPLTSIRRYYKWSGSNNPPTAMERGHNSYLRATWKAPWSFVR